MNEILSKLETHSLQSLREDFTIVIDSGHGWLTGGKRSIDGSLRENEFNTAVEDKLALLFHLCNIDYYQTAAGWKDEGLKRRKNIENKLFRKVKERNKMMLGVSIHADAYPGDTDANGFCVYYYQKGRNISQNGKRLARCVANSIIESDYKNRHVIKPRHNRGIKGQNYFMLRETKGIWVLIENGFMTNERDLLFLKDDRFRNNRAVAIFDGLIDFSC